MLDLRSFRHQAFFSLPRSGRSLERGFDRRWFFFGRKLVLHAARVRMPRTREKYRFSVRQFCEPSKVPRRQTDSRDSISLLQIATASEAGWHHPYSSTNACKISLSTSLQRSVIKSMICEMPPARTTSFSKCYRSLKRKISEHNNLVNT
jgi:hypothetical protein